MTQFREITAGGESDNIAPDPTIRTSSTAAASTGSTCAPGRRATSIRRSPTPTITAATWTLPLVLAARSARALLRQPAHVPHRRRRRALDADQPRPDARRSRRAAEPRSADRGELRSKGPRRGVIYAIAPSPLQRRTDLGRHRRRADLADARRRRALDERHAARAQPWSKVGIIEPSHFDPDTAYAAIDRHRLDDQRPYIYRTHDGGRTWQPIATGMPTRAADFVNAVREDPVQQRPALRGHRARRLRLVR